MAANFNPKHAAAGGVTYLVALMGLASQLRRGAGPLSFPIKVMDWCCFVYCSSFRLIVSCRTLYGLKLEGFVVRSGGFLHACCGGESSFNVQACTYSTPSASGCCLMCGIIITARSASMDFTERLEDVFISVLPLLHVWAVAYNLL